MKKILYLSIIFTLLIAFLQITNVYSKAPKLIKATVVRIIDSVTVEVKYNNTKQSVRLIGVDCPEGITKEALEFVKKTLLNKTVHLELTQSKDKSGRLLAYIWLSQPKDTTDKEIRSKMFNAILLLNGYSQLAVIISDTRYSDKFSSYQKEAKGKQLGLWAKGKKQEQKPVGIGYGYNGYIGNKSTKVFHRLTCSSVEQMKEENKVFFRAREEAEKSGYKACKRCNP